MKAKFDPICSFCKRGQSEREKFILSADKQAMICEGCVEVAATLISDMANAKPFVVGRDKVAVLPVLVNQVT